MDINVQTRLKDDELMVSVEVTNNGDEPAYYVTGNVEVGGHSKVGDTREILDVKESFKIKFDFKLPFDKPGNYPVLIRVDFADGNQYPFSALSLRHINYGEAISPRIFGKMDPLQIAKKGKVRLKLKCLDEKEKALTVRLILPKEISTSDPVRKIEFKPGKEEDISFRISNFSALVGANYPIYALMEYEDEEKHYFTAAMTTVEIIEKGKLTEEYRFVLLGVLIGLLILYFLIVLVRKRKKTKFSP